MYSSLVLYMVKLFCVGKILLKQKSSTDTFISMKITKWTFVHSFASGVCLLIGWVNSRIAVIVNFPKLCKIHKRFRQNLVFQQRPVQAIGATVQGREMTTFAIKSTGMEYANETETKKPNKFTAIYRHLWISYNSWLAECRRVQSKFLFAPPVSIECPAHCHSLDCIQIRYHIRPLSPNRPSEWGH